VLSSLHHVSETRRALASPVAQKGTLCFSPSLKIGFLPFCTLLVFIFFPPPLAVLSPSHQHTQQLFLTAAVGEVRGLLPAGTEWEPSPFPNSLGSASFSKIKSNGSVLLQTTLSYVFYRTRFIIQCLLFTL